MKIQKSTENKITFVCLTFISALVISSFAAYNHYDNLITDLSTDFKKDFATIAIERQNELTKIDSNVQECSKLNPVEKCLSVGAAYENVVYAYFELKEMELAQKFDVDFYNKANRVDKAIHNFKESTIAYTAIGLYESMLAIRDLKPQISPKW